jgi:hypothetical protein
VVPGGVHPAVPACDRAGLGGQHDLVAHLELLHQLAEQALGVAVRIGVGGVDEGAAGVEEGCQLVAGLVLVRAARPGARAEAQSAHPQAGPAQRPKLHGGTLHRSAEAAP